MRADRAHRTQPALLLGLVFLAATATGLGLHIGQADGWWITGAILVAAVAYGLVAMDESTPIPVHPTRAPEAAPSRHHRPAHHRPSHHRPSHHVIDSSEVHS